jgi:hypothetical protein
MVEVVAGGDFATWAIDMKENGCNGIVIGCLTDLENEVVNHARPDLAGNLLCDDSEEINLGDSFFLGIVSFDKLFLKIGGRFNVGRAREKGVVAGKEEEIGEEAASEQNEANDEKEF